MDTTKTTTHVSLCAGYGGIDLGLGRAIPDLRTIAFSEIEAFACSNLVSKMEAGLLDAAPIWTNLKTFPWSEFRDRVDILSGGYPCQPFSAAGKRLGRDDPRHLWPWIADGIRAMRPRICFFENVEGHISLGLREVISELEGIGYKTTWGIFSAREVGAPHQRKRVFILAYLCSEGLEGLRECYNTQGRQAQTRHTGSSCDVWISQLADPSDSSDPASRYAEADRLSSEHRSAICSRELRGANATAWPSRPGQPQHEWEPPRVVGNAKHDGSHQCGEESRGEITGSEQGRMQELEGGSPSMGNTSNRSNGQQPTKQQGRNTSGRSSEESGAMGDTETRWRGESGDETCEGQGHRSARPSRSNDELSKTEPSLGRDSDGASYRMDDAELFFTSDNRTDELRLLGNGVVPATAERAFLILMDQLLNQ